MTVPIDRDSNVGTFFLAPGVKAHEAFPLQADCGTDNDPLTVDSQLASDDEHSTDLDVDHPDQDDWEADWGEDDQSTVEGTDSEPRTMDFNLTPMDQRTSERMLIPDEDEEDKPPNSPAELLHAHHRFNHTSFGELQMMVKSGTLPGRLAKCPMPTCSLCLCGEAMKRPQ